MATNFQSVNTVTGGNKIGGGSGLALRTFYSRTLIDTLYQWLVIALFADARPIPLRSGQTIDWRTFARLSAAGALTEGTAPTSWSDLTVTNVSATVLQYGDIIQWSDKLLDTGPDPYVVKTLELQGQQIALTFDSLIQTEILAGTNVSYISPRVSRVTIAAGDIATTALFDTMIYAMQNRHVPYVTGYISGSGAVDTKVGSPGYVAVVTPLMWKVIKGLSGVDKAEKYQQNTTLFPLEVGKYDAIRFLMSTSGYIAAAGGAGTPAIDVMLMPLFGNLAFGRSTITGKEIVPVIRPIDQPDSADVLGQKGHIGWKAYYVAKILDQNKIQRGEFAGV